MAAKFVVVVETPESAAPAISGDDTQTCKNLAAFFNKVASGNAGGGAIRVLNNATSSVYTITFTSALLDGDFFGITGDWLYAETGTIDAASKFAAGVSAEADAASFCSLVNTHAAYTPIFSASVAGAVVTLTCLTPGESSSRIYFTNSTDDRVEVNETTTGTETRVTFST